MQKVGVTTVPTARGCCENGMEGQGEIPPYGLRAVQARGRASSTFRPHPHCYGELWLGSWATQV